MELGIQKGYNLLLCVGAHQVPFIVVYYTRTRSPVLCMWFSGLVAGVYILLIVVINIRGLEYSFEHGRAVLALYLLVSDVRIAWPSVNGTCKESTCEMRSRSHGGRAQAQPHPCLTLSCAII